LISTEVNISVVSYDFFPEQHPEVQFTFVMKRNLSAYGATLITPAIGTVLKSIA
jgi:hypothetical protein